MDGQVEGSFRLPQDMLVRVLQRVSLHDRLSSCARVSSAWHAAAVAATSTITIPEQPHSSKRYKCQVLKSWLCTHGQVVTSLSVDDDCELQLPYPCIQGLRQLCIDSITVPSTPCEGVGPQHAPGTPAQNTSLAALSGLSKLQALDCIMDLQGLAELSGLQHLQLHLSRERLMCRADPDALLRRWRHRLVQELEDPAVATHMGRMFSNNCSILLHAVLMLTQLSHLSLGGLYCHGVMLAHISCLTQLRELDLRPGAAQKDDEPPNTPPQMAVAKFLPQADVTLCPATLPRLCELAQLQKLTLSGTPIGAPAEWKRHPNNRSINAPSIEFCPAVLCGLHQLQHLEVAFCRLTGAEEDPDGLAVLSQLTGLQHLSLTFMVCWCTDQDNKRACLEAAECAALTTSSHLTHLNLKGVLLPTNSSKKMFPRRMQLPKLLGKLHMLVIEAELLADPVAFVRLGRCCPGLQVLVIHGTFAEIAQHAGARVTGDEEVLISLTGLEQLTSLVELDLEEQRVDGHTAFSVLAQLTALKWLTVEDIVHASLADAMQLMCCKQLLDLEVAMFCADGRVRTWGPCNSPRPYRLSLPGRGPPVEAGSEEQTAVWCQLPRQLLEAAVEVYQLGVDLCPFCEGLARDHYVQGHISSRTRVQLLQLLDAIDSYSQKKGSTDGDKSGASTCSLTRSATDSIHKCLQKMPTQKSLFAMAKSWRTSLLHQLSKAEPPLAAQPRASEGA